MKTSGLSSQKLPYSEIDELSESDYLDLALDTFEMIEKFALNLVPILWQRETTVLQAQISSLVLMRQLQNRPVYVSELAEEIGRPKTTVQSAIDKMIEGGLIVSEIDHADARKKLIKVPLSRASEVGQFERLLIQFRLKAMSSLKKRLSLQENSGLLETYP